MQRTMKTSEMPRFEDSDWKLHTYFLFESENNLAFQHICFLEIRFRGWNLQLPIDETTE